MRGTLLGVALVAVLGLALELHKARREVRELRRRELLRRLGV